MDLLTPLRSCFPRRKTFENFVAISFGLLMALGRGRLSEALVCGGLVELKHWSAFYRFFSRSSWSKDQLSLAVARLIVVHLVPADGPIVVAGDDTLHAKGGAHIFGTGVHRDPLTSTRTKAQFQHGHCWVVLSVVVRLPFDRRPRALPVLFRLNVPTKKCPQWGVEHRKKTEQFAEMLTLFAAAFPGRKLRVVGDDAYSNKTVLRALPKRAVMVGRLNLNAQLNGPVPPRQKGNMGPPRKWGDRIPTPEQTAKDTTPWELVEATLYGRTVTVRLKQFTAWWRSAGPDRQLKCVVVWRPHGRWPYEAFFSTDPTMTARQVLEAYSERWPLEVTFHETKDSLGAHRGQPRNPRAVARTAPVKFLLYSIVTLWYAQHGHGSTHATWKLRPWHRHKQSASFADMVTTFRRATFASALPDRAGAGPPCQEVDPGLASWFEQAA